MAKDKKIGNEQTKVSKTIKLNDRDYLNDILATEKAIGVNTSIALNEASNEKLYTKIKEFQNDINNCQHSLFELAFSKGWYTLEESESNKVKTAKQNLKTLLDELNHRI